jgi:hypothetical protein
MTETETDSLELAFDAVGITLGLLTRMLGERKHLSEVERAIASMTQGYDRTREAYNKIQWM